MQQEPAINEQEAWADMKEKLQQKKKRRFIFWWWFFGAFIAFLIGFGFIKLTKNNESKNEVVLNNSQKRADNFNKNNNDYSSTTAKLENATIENNKINEHKKIEKKTNELNVDETKKLNYTEIKNNNSSLEQNKKLNRSVDLEINSDKNKTQQKENSALNQTKSQSIIINGKETFSKRNDNKYQKNNIKKKGNSLTIAKDFNDINKKKEHKREFQKRSSKKFNFKNEINKSNQTVKSKQTVNVFLDSNQSNKIDSSKANNRLLAITQNNEDSSKLNTQKINNSINTSPLKNQTTNSKKNKKKVEFGAGLDWHIPVYPLGSEYFLQGKNLKSNLLNYVIPSLYTNVSIDEKHIFILGFTPFAQYNNKSVIYNSATGAWSSIASEIKTTIEKDSTWYNVVRDSNQVVIASFLDSNILVSKNQSIDKAFGYGIYFDYLYKLNKNFNIGVGATYNAVTSFINTNNVNRNGTTFKYTNTSLVNVSDVQDKVNNHFISARISLLYTFKKYSFGIQSILPFNGINKEGEINKSASFNFLFRLKLL